VSLLIVIPGLVLALFTLAASLAAVFKVNRLKSVSETAERAADAWQDERDAAIAREERKAAEHAQEKAALTDQIMALERRVKELEEANARLQERTDLTHYFDTQEQNHHEVVSEMQANTASVRSLATAIETLATMLRPLTAAI
jgi:uncharacterized protein (DUF3084 family)